MLRNENTEGNSMIPETNKHTHTHTQIASYAHRVRFKHDYKYSVFIFTIFTKTIVNLKYCFYYAK